MVTTEEIRRLAMSLPRTEERLVRDRVTFRVGRIVYATLSADETSLGFGYPKEHRAALVAAEPEKFHLPRTSDLRYHWVQAWMSALDAAEARELITDAWQMAVPRRVYAAHAATLAVPP